MISEAEDIDEELTQNINVSLGPGIIGTTGRAFALHMADSGLILAYHMIPPLQVFQE